MTKEQKQEQEFKKRMFLEHTHYETSRQLDLAVLLISVVCLVFTLASSIAMVWQAIISCICVISIISLLASFYFCNCETLYLSERYVFYEENPGEHFPDEFDLKKFDTWIDICNWIAHISAVIALLLTSIIHVILS